MRINKNFGWFKQSKIEQIFAAKYIMNKKELIDLKKCVVKGSRLEFILAIKANLMFIWISSLNNKNTCQS